MKRETTQTIWKTVVFAGAMLGAPACKSKPATTTPNTTSNTAGETAGSATPDPNATGSGTTGTADPCTGDVASPDRPRGADDDGGGGAGRGFVLS